MRLIVSDEVKFAQLRSGQGKKRPTVRSDKAQFGTVLR